MTWIMQVGEAQYPLRSFADLPLDAIDAFEEETGLTVDAVETLWESKDNLALTKAGRQAIRVRAWVCRRAAGEDITVAEATGDAPLRDIFVSWDGPDALPDPTQVEEDGAEPSDSTD